MTDRERYDHRVGYSAFVGGMCLILMLIIFGTAVMCHAVWSCR